MSDYYDDFCSNLRAIISHVRFGHDSADAQAARRRWNNLSKLYGSVVFPAGLLHCLNGGLDTQIHVRGAPTPSSSDKSPAAQALESVGHQPDDDFCILLHAQLFELLRKRVLVVDEQPTLTRMFTFSPHLHCFLRLQFLGCLLQLINSRGSERQEHNRMYIPVRCNRQSSRASAGE